METYIAILRGINVSGKKLIKMEELRKHLIEINLKDVQTYIQSGNIVFKHTKEEQDLLSKRIADKIKKEYDFEVPLQVINRKELLEIAEHNPFIIQRNEDVTKLHVTFLANYPDELKLLNITSVSDKPNEAIIAGKVIYLLCPEGYGSIKLTNNFIESKLKVTATTRNWNTVMKLLEISSI